MRPLLAILILASACTRPALNGSGCKDLDERTCKQTAGCAVGQCTDCAARNGFAGCYAPATESAPPCPAISCAPPCKLLTNEIQCTSRSDCRANTCSGCKGESFFVGCRGANEAPSPCPLGACAPDCANAADLATCDARPDCHPVFRDPGTCACAQPGCCMMFTACADGAHAACDGMPLCEIPTPYCEGDYVVGHTQTCYEGCVRKSDCL